MKRAKGERDDFSLEYVLKTQWAIRCFEDFFPDSRISSAESSKLSKIIKAVFGIDGSPKRLIDKALSGIPPHVPPYPVKDSHR
jgi:hypothetical protein